MVLAGQWNVSSPPDCRIISRQKINLWAKDIRRIGKPVIKEQIDSISWSDVRLGKGQKFVLRRCIRKGSFAILSWTTDGTP